MYLGGKVGGSGDGHRVFPAGGHVLGGDVQDTLAVDFEGQLDLRHPARRRRVPSGQNRPRFILSAAIDLSPCSTWMSTVIWPSSGLENTLGFSKGTVVLRGISGVLPRPWFPRPARVA